MFNLATLMSIVKINITYIWYIKIRQFEVQFLMSSASADFVRLYFKCCLPLRVNFAVQAPRLISNQIWARFNTSRTRLYPRRSDATYRFNHAPVYPLKRYYSTYLKRESHASRDDTDFVPCHRQSN